MAGLKLRAITKSWDGKAQMIKPLTLDVADREFIAIVGPSGYGKSTLLWMAIGLERVNGGDIWIDNKCTTGMESRDRGIAIVFQNYVFCPHMSVEEDTTWELKIRGVGREHAAERVNEAAHILEPSELPKCRPRRLSGGQRQRIAMGRAIVRDPVILLFDELLSSPDVKLRVQMRLGLRHLHHRLKTTSLYVVHDQVEAVTPTQRVMVMNKGIAEQVDTPVEVYEEPANCFATSLTGNSAMNLLGRRISAVGTHFQLESSMTLPIGRNARESIGRKMTSGVHPERTALSSQTGGGVPLVADTLGIPGASNLTRGRWGEQKLVVRLAHQYRPTVGSTLQLHLPENHLHLFDGETRQHV